MSDHEKKIISDYCLLLNNLYLALYKNENLFRWAYSLEKKEKQKGSLDETEKFLNELRDAGTSPFLEPSSDLYVKILNLYAGEGNPLEVSGNQRLFYIAHLAGWRPEKDSLLDKITAFFKDEKRVTKTVKNIRLELASNMAEWVYIKSARKHEFLRENDVSWRTDTVKISEYIVERNRYLISKYCKSYNKLREVIGYFAENMLDAEKERSNSNPKMNNLFDHHEEEVNQLCDSLNRLLLAYDNATTKDQKEEYLGRCLAWLVLGAMLREALSCELITRYLEPFIPKTDIEGKAENNNIERKENSEDIIVNQQDVHGNLFNRLMSIFSNDRNKHPSIRMMNPDPSLFPKGLPEIHSDRRYAVENDREPRAIRDMVLDSWKREDRRHILLVGEGGIGKTVSMLMLPNETWFKTYNIPVIYVKLQNLSAYEGDLSRYIQDKIGADYARIIVIANIIPQEHPLLLLLLDGFNEIPDKYKGIASKWIRVWMEKPGVQIITTSRLGFSLENHFTKYLLQPLPYATIKSFLLSAGIREERLPMKNDRIWNVINVPLMLTMYTRIDKVKEIADYSSISFLLDWKIPDNATNIIWNYLQMELFRCIENTCVDNTDVLFSPVKYAVAILALAPYICAKMSKMSKLFLKQDGDQDEFQDIIIDAISFYKGHQNLLSRQILNIRRKYERWQKRSRQLEDELFLPEMELEYSKILVDHIALFKEQESVNKNKCLIYTYSLAHQNFRDALAAFYICSCLPKASDSKDKTLLLDYADYYVKNHIADYYSEEEIVLIWERHRREEPWDGHLTWILMDIIGRKRSYDYRDLDFSNLNLNTTNIYRHLTKRLDICPLPSDRRNFENTIISSDSISPKGHAEVIKSVAFSPDGIHIASGSEDGTVRIWALESGECRILSGHLSGIECVAYSPDGMSISSGSLDGSVRIEKLDTGECQVLDGYSGGIKSVVYSPDGKQLASGSLNRTIQIWDLKSLTFRSFEGHSEGIECMAFSSDGKLLASGSGDSTVRIWNIGNGGCRILKGHSGRVNSVSCSPDGKYVASASDDLSLRIWNLESEECQVIEGHLGVIKCVMFSPDGTQIASGSEDRTVRIWDLESGACRLLEGYTGGIESVAYSPDGRQLATGSDDKIARVWDLETGECRILGGQSGWIESISFSPDGKLLACGAEDKTVRIWNLEDEKCHTIEGHSGEVESVAFSPCGKYIASASMDKTVRIVDLIKGESQILEGHLGGIKCISYNKDGKLLASGSFDNTIKIWDLEKKKSLTLEGHSREITCVVFSPDGRQLASGSADGSLRIWNVENGKCRVLERHSILIQNIIYSQDGCHLACSYIDGTVRLWDIESGRSRFSKGIFGLNKDRVYSLDGSKMAYRVGNGIVSVEDLKKPNNFKYLAFIPTVNLSGVNFELAKIKEEDKSYFKILGAIIEDSIQNAFLFL